MNENDLMNPALLHWQHEPYSRPMHNVIDDPTTRSRSVLFQVGKCRSNHHLLFMHSNCLQFLQLDSLGSAPSEFTSPHKTCIGAQLTRSYYRHFVI